jgi:pimeloyl-ACP methyl ester carboxylesterase
VVFAAGNRLTIGADERISFGIPIIGCPDYLKLMEQRAAKFSIAVAPPFFPPSLVELVKRRDPAAKAFDREDGANPYLGKKVLVLAGGADPLVPWEASREFVERLEVGASGVKKAVVVAGVGHECTREMLVAAGEFVGLIT